MHHQHHSHVLQLDIQGTPQAWISLEHAALHVAAGAVAWVDGDGPLATLRGGFNVARGRQSLIDVHPIVALHGASKVNLFDVVPAFSKGKLFRRDRMTCAYCSQRFHERELPEHARMPLVYLPYVPSRFEDFLLEGRHIRADVHEWLAARLPKGSRLS
jgi:hypothetical protein